MGKRDSEIPAVPTDNPEHKLADILQEHGEKMLYGAGILLVLVLALIYFVLGRDDSTVADLIRADREVAAFQQGTPAVSLDTLQQLIKNDRALEEKYAADLAQFWITEGNYQEALPWVKEAKGYHPLKLLPRYKSFADATLEASRGRLEESLEQSEQLKSQLADREENSALSTLNLVRIAFLHQALNKAEEELAAWEEVLSDKEGEEMLASIRDGSLTMKDYIDERVNTLKNTL